MKTFWEFEMPKHFTEFNPNVSDVHLVRFNDDKYAHFRAQTDFLGHFNHFRKILFVVMSSKLSPCTFISILNTKL